MNSFLSSLSISCKKPNAFSPQPTRSAWRNEDKRRESKLPQSSAGDMRQSNNTPLTRRSSGKSGKPQLSRDALGQATIIRRNWIRHDEVNISDSLYNWVQARPQALDQKRLNDTRGFKAGKADNANEEIQEIDEIEEHDGHGIDGRATSLVNDVPEQFMNTRAHTEDQSNRARAAVKIQRTIQGRAKSKLNLSGAKLVDLPKDIGQSNAESVDLKANRLPHIPEPLLDIINLQRLNLSQNEIEEIPREISRLMHLVVLDLSSNRIRELPRSIGRLARLQTLNLSNNHIDELTDSVAQLVNLKTLSVANNALRMISTKIGELLDLENIDLSNNPSLKEIPEEWAPLFNWSLTCVNLKNIGMSNFIPLETYPARLKFLNVENNRNLSTLPKVLGPMTQTLTRDRIQTSKKGRKIDILTHGSYVVAGLASEGRVQIQFGSRTIAAGGVLPQGVRLDDDDERFSIHDVPDEPPTNDAPEQLILDPSGLTLHWKELKQEGAGPADLIDLKQAAYRQNLLTIFAFTFGEMQRLHGMDVNVPELELALHVAVAERLHLPLAEQLVDVGAVMLVTTAVIDEAIHFVENWCAISDEDLNMAANQMEVLVRSKASLALSDREAAELIHESNQMYDEPCAAQISEIYDLARSVFRQSIINKVAYIFHHFKEKAFYPIDAVETALLFQCLLAEKLHLPQGLKNVKLSDSVINLISPEELKAVKRIVLNIEKKENGSMLKSYLGNRSFWRYYSEDLASKLIVASDNTIASECQEIEKNKGWTTEYRKLRLGLFRQNTINLLAYFEAYTLPQEEALLNPMMVSLDYQIQLANELELPGMLREFPKDVASTLCGINSDEKVARVAQTIRAYEALYGDNIFEENIENRNFWQKHLTQRSEIQRNEQIFLKALDIVKNTLGKAGIRFYTGNY